MNCKNKSFVKKRKAFTLIELLIVIAIIGILFIVLVSKVDFATDKAKATGVQTDFRSFQLAFDTVAKENAGFNTFGWDTGDANGDGIRNSYDEGDANHNGKKDPGEVWTGHKQYAETWTGVYTLVKPGTDVLDADAIFKLESAINKNLDPKLYITIGTDGAITMANGAKDPWKTEYHGVYLTNATTDGKDRGAIIIYSNGANQEWGSEHGIANGVVTVTVPGNNKIGADDYSIVSMYTYANGYGEVGNITTGFSNNQTFFAGNGEGFKDLLNPDDGEGNDDETILSSKSSLNDYTWAEIKQIALLKLDSTSLSEQWNIRLGDVKEYNGNLYYLVDLDGNSYNGFVFMYNSNIQNHINPLPDGEQYLVDSYNDGGYASSAAKLNVDQIYESLPNNDELKQAIKNVNITCNDGRNFGNATHEISCHMFLPSVVEVGAYDSAAKLTNNYKDALLLEGEAFEYMTSNSIRASFAPDWWWTRSAYGGSTNANFVIRTNGTAYCTNTHQLDYYVIAFVVG